MWTPATPPFAGLATTHTVAHRCRVVTDAAVAVLAR